VNGKSSQMQSQMQMQMYRWKAVSVSLKFFSPMGGSKGRMVKESFRNVGKSQLYKRSEGFTRLALRTFCVSLPSHHCRRPKGGARGWRKAGAWAGLGFPATIYSSFGVGVGVNRNVGKLG